MLDRFLLPFACVALFTACPSDDDDTPSDGGGGSTTPPATTEVALDELDRALTGEDPALLVEAQDSFLELLVRDPGDDLARTMVGALGLVNFFNGSEKLDDFARRFGIVGTRDVFGALDLEFPETLPADSPRLGEIQQWVGDDLLVALVVAIELFEGVSPSFSETMRFTLDESDPDDDVEITIDYALVKTATGALRLVQGVLELTQVFDLDADIDRIVNFRFGTGQDIPYRIFTGLLPSTPEPNAFCPTDFSSGSVDRVGFFNDPLATGSSFFLPVADADAHLAATQGAVGMAMRDLVEGLGLLLLQFDPADCVGEGLGDLGDLGEIGDLDEFGEDLDLDSVSDIACLAADFIPLYQGGLRPWVLEIADAIEGIDPNVSQVTYDDGEDEIILPSFSLDASRLFSPATYDGRFFLPNYALSADPCIADANAFPNPDLFGLLPGATGDDWVEIWNGLNLLSDLLLVGSPKNDVY